MSISEGGAFAKYKSYDFIVPSVHNLATGNYACETGSQIDATTQLIGRIQESCNAYYRALRTTGYTQTCQIIFPVMERNDAFLKGLDKEGLQGISTRFTQMMQAKKDCGKPIDIDDQKNPNWYGYYDPTKNAVRTDASMSKEPGMHYIGFAYDVNSMLAALKSFNLLFASILELKQKDI